MRIQIPAWPQAGEREVELLRIVLESGQWGGFHPFVSEFEQSFAAYQHSAYGISAFNGTVTIEAALTVLGIGAGDEVIVPAISFISTATAVARVGAIPVFVDIDPDTFNIDPQRVSRAISPRSKALVAVHFGGLMCDMGALETVCARHGLILLEDAAHAQGSEWDGRRAGSFGIAGSFSFQNGKVLSAGEGGLLVTSDERFASSARALANCGRHPGESFYQHFSLGTNLRMSAFQAAVLLAQFERLPQQIAFRRTNGRALKQSLSDLKNLVWQQEPPEATNHSHYLLIGRTEASAMRDRICQELEEAGVPCTPFYPHTLYRNELFRTQPCRVMPCPVAEECVQKAFWLPHRVLLAEPDNMQLIANVIRAAVRGADQ